MKKVLLLLSCFFGTCFAQQNENDIVLETMSPDLPSAVEKEVKTSELPIEQIRKFVDIFTRIKHQYVEELSDEQLFEKSIVGLLNELDPHSVYLQKDSLERVNQDANGHFVGIGVELTIQRGALTVIAAIENTPADKAGIQSGDVILKIDNEVVTGLDFQKSIERMRGESGSQMQLTIMRGEDTPPFSVTVERTIVQTKSVRYRQITDNIAYIKVARFQKNTASQFRKHMIAIKENPEIEGLVLDLRNNPGGLLQPAIAIADMFLTEGIIVSTKGRGSRPEVYQASLIDIFKNKPLVVLVNAGSASASEIVAGALQDHNRAIVMGTQSFGKGSVQKVIPINDKEAIKLTVAKYYTPNGESIQARGITPHIIVEQNRIQKPQDKALSVSENDLPGHLKASKAKPKNTKKKSEGSSQLTQDFQLQQAVNAIKARILFP